MGAIARAGRPIASTWVLEQQHRAGGAIAGVAPLLADD